MQLMHPNYCQITIMRSITLYKTVEPTNLPSLSFRCSIERERVLDPPIDATECHHALWGTADSQSDERSIGQRWLVAVRGLFARRVLELFSTASVFC